MNPMLHLLRGPRDLPTSVLAAFAEWVGWTYPALVSKADESITWVASVEWATCIAIRVALLDFQSYTISVAFGAFWRIKSGDRHRCCCDRVGLL
ncbi:uncharacterized protein N7479_001957 [Penicillium vulpinum]|uniref:uncharacterized protein n=1 Tax=Penicillium vulpinum TaxID=29845 RepID=UPI00254709ED|nr:uncharacterized protein N7479_001957 [Penicillium vulpinum]KAJ5972039.1 hypothetical protein N7479_001957 [Penicillium vulpinum]